MARYLPPLRMPRLLVLTLPSNMMTSVAAGSRWIVLWTRFAFAAFVTVVYITLPRTLGRRPFRADARGSCSLLLPKPCRSFDWLASLSAADDER